MRNTDFSCINNDDLEVYTDYKQINEQKMIPLHKRKCFLKFHDLFFSWLDKRRVGRAFCHPKICTTFNTVQVNIVGKLERILGDLLIKKFHKYSKNCILLKILPNPFKTKRNEKIDDHDCIDIVQSRKSIV